MQSDSRDIKVDFVFNETNAQITDMDSENEITDLALLETDAGYSTVCRYQQSQIGILEDSSERYYE